MKKIMKFLMLVMFFRDVETRETNLGEYFSQRWRYNYAGSKKQKRHFERRF